MIIPKIYHHIDFSHYFCVVFFFFGVVYLFIFWGLISSYRRRDALNLLNNHAGVTRHVNSHEHSVDSNIDKNNSKHYMFADRAENQHLNIKQKECSIV